MVHIPATSSTSASDTGTSNVSRDNGACVLISGGHAGLVRCSAISDRPPQKHIRQAVTGRPRISKPSGQPSAARTPSAANHPVPGKPSSVTAVSVDTSGRIVPAAGSTAETKTSDGVSLPPPPPVGGQKQPQTVAPAHVPTFIAAIPNTTKPAGNLSDKNRSVDNTAMTSSLAASTTTVAAAADNPPAAGRSSTAGRRSGSQDVAWSAVGRAAGGKVIKAPLIRPRRLPRADREAFLKRSREHASDSGSTHSTSKRARSAAVTKPRLSANGAAAAAARLAGVEAGEGVARSSSLGSSEKTADVACSPPVAISIGTERGKSATVTEGISRIPGLELRGGIMAASQREGGRDSGGLEGQGGHGGVEAPALVVPAWAIVPKGFGDAGPSGEDGGTQKRRALSI